MGIVFKKWVWLAKFPQTEPPLKNPAYGPDNLHNNTLSQRATTTTTTTMRSNDTLVDTSFQLISESRCLLFEHAEQASSRGVLEGGRQQAC